MVSFVHRTRSVRVTVTMPDGQVIEVDNPEYNTGVEIDFTVVRDMTPALGSVELRLYNLPAYLRGDLEAAQARKPDDLDQVLATIGQAKGWTVFGDSMAIDGSSALGVGLSLVKIEAGYDGAVSELIAVVGSRAVSERDDETTYVTTISGEDALDVALYARPTTVFEPGTPTFDVLRFLRIACGLGPGNVTAATWTAIVGDSRLAAYYYSAMPGLDALAQLLDFLPLRWWIDGRELYVIPKDGQPYPPGVPPPYVVGAVTIPDVLLERPRRLEGGFVEVRSLLTPAILPGRLFLLSATALGLEGAAPAEILRADVPPGLYRAEEVRHEGSTSAGGDFDTTIKGKRIGSNVEDILAVLG
jgi:hypothetical protein